MLLSLYIYIYISYIYNLHKILFIFSSSSLTNNVSKRVIYICNVKNIYNLIDDAVHIDTKANFPFLTYVSGCLFSNDVCTQDEICFDGK